VGTYFCIWTLNLGRLNPAGERHINELCPETTVTSGLLPIRPALTELRAASDLESAYMIWDLSPSDYVQLLATVANVGMYIHNRYSSKQQ